LGEQRETVDFKEGKRTKEADREKKGKRGAFPIGDHPEEVGENGGEKKNRGGQVSIRVHGVVEKVRKRGRLWGPFRSGRKEGCEKKKVGRRLAFGEDRLKRGNERGREGKI